MIHTILTLAIVWLAYKAVTRGFMGESSAQAAGIVLGGFFGLVAGIAFIVGGNGYLLGYAIFVLMLAAWIHRRRTLPENLEQALAEYEAMKPELDALKAESEKILKPKRLPLP